MKPLIKIGGVGQNTKMYQNMHDAILHGIHLLRSESLKSFYLNSYWNVCVLVSKGQPTFRVSSGLKDVRRLRE